MQEIRLTIPHFGYQVETRKRMVDRDSAPEVLTAAMQQKITHAIRNDHADQALFSAFSIWKERSGIKEYDNNDAENEE